MKRSVQTGFLPLLALIAVLFSASDSAHAKAQKAAQQQVDDLALFKTSDYPLIVGTTAPPPFKNNKMDCSLLPQRPLGSGLTAWERGFNQGFSGMRASHKVTIGRHTLPERSPCQEYDSLAASSLKGQEERACCARAFVAGVHALADYMSQCSKERPTEAEPLLCYEAFETGSEAARRMCGSCLSAESAEEKLKDLKLTTPYPGCMAMGFHQKTRQCDSDPKSMRRPAASAYFGSVRDQRSGSGKTDDIVGRFSKMMGVTSGGAHIGHNHPPGTPHTADCDSEDSQWSDVGRD
jgi:hypothetical protein